MNRSRRAGFTLMEVMIALGIMAMVMVALYSTLNATLRARDQIEVESRTARLGPQILDLIEADLRRAWILDIDGDRVFLGETRTIDGEPADSITLLTNVDSSVTRRVNDREVESDVCETGYRLRRNPELPDVMELWRRQSFHVDEEPLKDGVYERLHDRVVRFQVRYRETLDQYADVLMDWDASKKHRLPAVVELELALEAVPRTVGDLGRQDAASRTLVYKRSIPLPAESAMVMRIHSIPPTFAAAGGTSGGSNLGANPATGGPKGGGGGEGGGEGGIPGMGGNGGPGGPGGSGGGGGGGPKDPFGGMFGGGGGGGGGKGSGGAQNGNFNDFLNQLLGGK
jgi:prepilin-type N-terminal cleavage/methylation domain-containing protein